MLSWLFVMRAELYVDGKNIELLDRCVILMHQMYVR